eukprot:TRINITY_DN33650_c0_g1_i1.p1 TRINITY_DN33650_c0_g1~~TRINITY_DN33650_c0_g1_i1.p1  ORF type:complete len:223 (+),score=24.32 TRINITY_DN33650_c0_g1_i1:228-896(+)
MTFELLNLQRLNALNVMPLSMFASNMTGLSIVLSVAYLMTVSAASDRVGPSKYFKELDVDKFGDVFQKSRDSLVLFYRSVSPLNVKLSPYFERLAADVRKRSKHVDFFRVDEVQQRFPAKGKWPGLEKEFSAQTEDAEMPNLFYVNASSAKGEMMPSGVFKKLAVSTDPANTDDTAYDMLVLYVYIHANWRVQRKLKKHPRVKRQLKEIDRQQAEKASKNEL